MVFYLLGILYIAYEIDKYVRMPQYLSTSKDIENYGEDKKAGKNAIWTRAMTTFAWLEFSYLIWAIVGIFSEQRLYFIWILAWPAFFLLAGKTFREAVKARREESWYRIGSSFLFGIIPLAIMIFTALRDSVPF